MLWHCIAVVSFVILSSAHAFAQSPAPIDTDYSSLLRKMKKTCPVPDYDPKNPQFIEVPYHATCFVGESTRERRANSQFGQEASRPETNENFTLSHCGAGQGDDVYKNICVIGNRRAVREALERLSEYPITREMLRYLDKKNILTIMTHRIKDVSFLDAVFNKNRIEYNNYFSSEQGIYWDDTAYVVVYRCVEGKDVSIKDFIKTMAHVPDARIDGHDCYKTNKRISPFIQLGHEVVHAFRYYSGSSCTKRCEGPGAPECRYPKIWVNCEEREVVENFESSMAIFFGESPRENYIGEFEYKR